MSLSLLITAILFASTPEDILTADGICIASESDLGRLTLLLRSSTESADPLTGVNIPFDLSMVSTCFFAESVLPLANTF